MDTSLAPVVADIFMNDMEIGLCEWQRYIDNTFVLIEPTPNVADVLSILNDFYLLIKFTKEIDHKSVTFFSRCQSHSII
jgi:hypothetical protein